MSDTMGSIPRQIGRYPVLGELGRGGMGVVYLAEDPRLERRIAIKVMSERLAGDPRRLGRFEREAKLLASLNHPHIATIHSLEEADCQTFLTLEFIEGETLTERLSAGSLSTDDTISLSRQIASALEAAHKQGIVHRDLKPANVKITPSGLVKVLDFGIAKVVQEPSVPAPSDEHTATEAVVGTPGYMSPEQALGEPVDHRADIWALGCIVYECLAGRRAVAGSTPHERLAATVLQEPDWGALPEETPEWLRRLMVRCLAKQVEDRLATATEARRAFEDQMTRQAVSALLAASSPERATSTPNNLPVQLTNFIGREREIAHVTRLLAESRLVTFTGAGGCGKSRLAVEVAGRVLEAFADGAWLVELAPIADGSQVPRAVAASLGLKDIRAESLVEKLEKHLRKKRALILLDSCEHLIESCAWFTERLLLACPQVVVLATSREGLGISGELSYRVPSLGLPAEDQPLSLEEVARSDSISLFVERSRRGREDFQLTAENSDRVIEICRALDGMPLAIELAAARMKTLTVHEIADRLGERLRLLTWGSRTALPRLRTLRGCIDWSYEKLSDGERTLFRRLSVFSGGWTLASAETVCSWEGIEGWEVLDLLTRLLDKSLVELDVERTQRQSEARYRMLETIREYARERLVEESEEESTRRRHQEYFVALVEESRPHLDGPEQGRWLARLETEHDNIRSVLEDCKASGGEDAETGLRIAEMLGRYWVSRGYWDEGRAIYRELLALPRPRERSPSRAGALRWAGYLASYQGDLLEARSLAEESLAVSTELGDKSEIAHSLRAVANVAELENDYVRARSLLKESLAIYRELGDRRSIAHSLSVLGNAAERQGDHVGARSLWEESLVIQRQLGDKRQIAKSLNNLGLVIQRAGDLAKARLFYEEGLAIRRQLADQAGVANSLHNLGCLALDRGDFGGARSLFEESLAIRRELGDRFGISMSLGNLGFAAAFQRDFALARSLHEESLKIQLELGDKRGSAMSLAGLGDLCWYQGDLDGARSFYRKGLAIQTEIGDDAGAAATRLSLGAIAIREGDYALARSLLDAGLKYMREQGDRVHIEAALRSFAELAAALGSPLRSARLSSAAEALRRAVGGSSPTPPPAATDTEGWPVDDLEGAEGGEDEETTISSAASGKDIAEARAEGRAMSMEQAVRYALREDDE